MPKVTIEIELDADELWSSVFGSAFESFGDHWVEVDYLGHTAWDKAGLVKLTCFDESYNEVTKMITIDDLVRALPIANDKVHMDLFDLENYDAVCGDAVLQVAVLGDVIFG